MYWVGKRQSIRALAIFLVIFLSGCRQKNNDLGKQVRALKGKDLYVALERVSEYEAKHADIPVPLSSKPIAYPVDTQSDMLLCYENDLACDAVIAFYEKEMAQSGWRCDAMYSGPETLLHFSKPQKFCSISIRPHYDLRRKMVHGSGIFIATGHRTV